MPVAVESFQVMYGANILLETDGSLWTWGSSLRGHIGVDNKWDQPVPVQILDSVTYVAPGGRFAILEDNSLWGWGLEVNEDDTLPMPVPVAPRFIMDDAVSVISTGRRDFVIRSDHSLWALGPCTDLAEVPWYAPFFVPSAEPVRVLDSVIRVYSTLQSDLVLQCNGRLWLLHDDELTHIMDEVAGVYIIDNIWAVNNLTSVFVTQTDGSLWSVSMLPQRSLPPIHVMDNVVHVFPFYDRTFVITKDNALWAWGDNPQGGLGFRSWNNTQNYPAHVMDGVRYLYFSHIETYVVRTDNTLWVWSSGPAPVGARPMISAPTQVMDSISRLYMGDGNIFAVDIYNALWVWQGGFWESTPSLVLDYVSYVNRRGFIFREDGSMWAMGSNSGRQIGDGTRVNRHYPVNISYIFSYTQGQPIAGLSGLYDPIETRPFENPSAPFVTSSWGAQFFVDTQARLWSWGQNWGSLLGRKTGEESYDFITDLGVVMDGVANIRSAGGNVYAIQEDGSLWAWGGEHGSSPVYVMGQVKAVHWAFPHYYALREDGTVWYWRSSFASRGAAWWDDHIHDLGDETIDFSEPTQIMEGVHALHIDGPVFYAHKLDGSLWAWMGTTGGRRFYIFEDPAPPARILENVAVLHITDENVFAIQTSGALWAWGCNDFGQLGDGTRTARPYPVRIMENVREIYSDGVSTFAVRADNSLWAWGWNALGQLGDGTFISRVSPVRIMAPMGEAIKSISMAEGSIFAIKADDSLWVWGSGVGPLPVHVLDSVAMVYVPASIFLWDVREHIFILQHDNRLWLLSDDLIEPELAFEGVAAVHSLMGNHYVIKTNGELWTWGISLIYTTWEMDGWDLAVRLH